jgi:hypothetical protein
MNDILELFVKIILLIAGFSFIYQLVPFKHYKNVKPKLAFFPKYIAFFENTIEEIELSLANLKFSLNEEGLYTRGKIYGNFAAKEMKLLVEVNEETKQLKVYSAFFGIFVDKGDLWQVTSDILNNKSY